jgi:hypothetical protein
MDEINKAEASSAPTNLRQEPRFVVSRGGAGLRYSSFTAKNPIVPGVR